MAVFAPFEDASQLVRCCSCSVLRIGQRLILSRTGGRRVPGFVRAPGRGVIGVNGAAAKTSIVVIRLPGVYTPPWNSWVPCWLSV